MQGEEGMAMTTRQRQREVHYRESDGKPMAESEVHLDELMRLILTLRDAFGALPDVYVGGNMLLYYEEGNPRASVAPDVFVVKGVPKQPPRRVYLVWREGLPPSIVIEVTSKSTRREDLNKKRALYARLGVREYVLYDPLGEYLRPALQGFRLADGQYQDMQPAAEGGLVSEELNMRLALVDSRLRLYDRQTGAELLSPSERVDAESAARRAAERRIAELEALLAQRNGTAERD
jgi:Uma2 family endonuclease